VADEAVVNLCGVGSERMAAVLDSELARRAVRGEPAAAAELLARIRPGVVRYCWAHLGSLGHAPVSPDDVAQEVCLAVFEGLPRFRDRGLPFAGFVFRIAANKVADAYRAARVASSTQPVATLPERTDDQWDPERRRRAGHRAWRHRQPRHRRQQRHHVPRRASAGRRGSPADIGETGLGGPERVSQCPSGHPR
jgi:DNA-directed RNA polymerase specialized sigma24 family protein